MYEDGGSMGRSKINRSAARRQELRAGAEERREHRASLSNAQQIERLNARLGEGEGAEKERARLEWSIEQERDKRKRGKSKGSTETPGSTQREKRKRKSRASNRGDD